MSMRRAFPGIVIAGMAGYLWCFPVSAGEKSGSRPSGPEILQRVQEGVSGIEDYTVTLDVVVDLERLKVPRMHATMYFKQPDKVHFVSDGFALLPKEGLGFSLLGAASKYTVDRVEDDTLDGHAEYRLTLLPKSERNGLRRTVLEVDPGRWTADRVESELPDGRSMTARFRHEEVRGHWLPSMLTVTFASAAEDSVDAGIVEQITPTRTRQQARAGTVVVRYSDYRINTGLSDDLFRSESTTLPKK